MTLNEIKAFPCDIEGCNKSFDKNRYLTQHKKVVHKIGGNLYKCDLCTYDTPVYASLTRHKASKHNIGVKLHHCEICGEGFKTTATLKQHEADEHDNYVNWHKCDICTDKFKELGNLKKHKAYAHDIDVTWHYCEICDKGFKTTSTLKQHKQHVHDIDVTWHYCEICDDGFKKASTLKKHKQNVHDIDVVWHYCEICNEGFKQADNLKRHKKLVHDIGDNECAFCIENRYSKISYTDHCGTHEICSKCFYKVTGKSSRIEIIWSDYLDEKLGTNALVLNDKNLKSIGGCTLYRPDKLYLFEDTVELAECDENQHSGNNYQCEDTRISDIYNEEGICGKFMYLIRFNPDKYFPNDLVIKRQLERFEIYVALVTKLRRLQHLDKIHIYYLFYDEDNDNISQEYPFTHIHSMEDVENL
ncbi:putative zinc finger domain containing protein [Aureococcus anophagefferens virus]|uniref:Putative zinc finger domain containing protein n=1 Tax=Aureococcus anophagefferens virus TaxID=1474867 RepID=A0A076FGG2_9VIRU|nr:putative zinc finger domain containing protein [Aureococcus anophagefferens virus]AII17165.1 putative zinc finger domain containing protein [Aureococcus anophagefferens virus]UOG94291.1 hypothetical protein MKD35_256 [Aureococcus anophagefferens virus]